MCDLMTFPDTVEEFMEEYKIIDTEQVYTNGAELVPIFRMKQWFEHLPTEEPEIIRCKDCKWFGEIGCAIHVVDDTDKPTENDYCSFAERRSDG